MSDEWDEKACDAKFSWSRGDDSLCPKCCRPVADHGDGWERLARKLDFHHGCSVPRVADALREAYRQGLERAAQEADEARAYSDRNAERAGRDRDRLTRDIALSEAHVCSIVADRIRALATKGSNDG
jgi:hypothetical protein